MANTLTLEQLQSFRHLLNAGNVSQFYTLMRDNGYAYAGWAQGVVDGDTIAGLAALDYLNDSAKMMGAVGPEATELPPETIHNIKADMGLGQMGSGSNGVGQMGAESLIPPLIGSF